MTDSVSFEPKQSNSTTEFHGGAEGGLGSETTEAPAYVSKANASQEQAFRDNSS